MKFMLLVAGLWSIIMLIIHKREIKKATRTTQGFFLICLGISWAVWSYMVVAKQVWHPTVWVGRVLNVFLPF